MDLWEKTVTHEHLAKEKYFDYNWTFQTAVLRNV